MGAKFDPLLGQLRTTDSSSGAVSSVSNSDGTLTVSPTTGSVIASIALGHANIWTAAQTFSTTPVINGVALSFVHDGTSLNNYTATSSHINFEDQMIFKDVSSGNNSFFWFDSTGTGTLTTLTVANNGTPQFSLAAATGSAILSGGASNDILFETDGGAKTSLTIHHFTQKVNTLNNILDDGTGNMSVAGKISITTGSNASAGTGTLSGGTATIATTAVTANSLIFLTDTAATLTNVGTLSVTAKTAGTSFTVTSSVAIDSSTFNWLIVN